MSDRYILPGCRHAPHPDHTVHAVCHPNESMQVTIWVAPQSDDDHRNTVIDFASRNGLVPIHRPCERALTVTGTVRQMDRAFGVNLCHFTHPDGNLYRGHLNRISVPADLKDIVTGVFGLDERPVARPHFRKRATGGAPAGSFTPTQLAALYDFPTATGQGQTIAIVELGGGYRPADLAAYWAELGISPTPHVYSVSVDGGRNAPTGDPNGPDGEVMLDIEVAGAVAPGARLAVYFAANTDQAFINAMAQAIHDKTVDASVVSLSWGGPEESWTFAAVHHMNSVLAEARALGVTVLVAAGDSGSSDGESDGKNHVDFPASSPHVVACGGTSLVAYGDAVVSEAVWNDGAEGGATGGGYSIRFPRPYYQTGPSAWRGVPDLAANADPATGYFVRVDGEESVIGGTSAVAPLMAGLIARCNERNGQRAGFINGAIAHHPQAFRDITSGNNGAFAAAPGWDACTGHGRPIGILFAQALKR